MNPPYIGRNTFKRIHFFWTYADFEGANEINSSNKTNRLTKNFQQSPKCNGYYIVSDLHDVLNRVF